MLFIIVSEREKERDGGRERESYTLPILWVQLQGRNFNSVHFHIINVSSLALLCKVSPIGSDTSTCAHLFNMLQEKYSWLIARVRAHRSSIECEGTVTPTSPRSKRLQWHLQIRRYQQRRVDLYCVAP